MTVRSRYRPGEERLLLGGDFLDVAVTPSGNVGFCIGDVGGHGARPAAVGASLRAGWRALALTGADPTAWLVGCADVFASSDPSGWTLVMFTDGLFEGYANAGASERLGVDRIERWCADLGSAPLDEHRLDALLAFVEDANGGPVGDDIGVLALSASTEAGSA